MEFEDEELNNIVTALPTTMSPASMEVNTGPVLINATTVTTTFAPSVLPSLTSIKFWGENRKICEMFTQAIQDLTRDLDPFAVVLIIVALTIAIVGAIAIVCQCQMWRKSKRQRHFDTSSWLEYSLDREKLTQNNNHHNAKLQRQMENKKFISKLFQSSLLPPVPPLSHQRHKIPLGPRPFSLNDSQLYLSSPNKHFTVDIDQCQLVQSFMKHSETGKQYMENKKKKGKEKEKVKQGVKGKGAKKLETNRNNRAKHSKNSKKTGAAYADTLPFFANSSLSSSSKMSEQENRSSTATVPAAALQKEYETQTMELNLTGSDDGESHTNVSIEEKIYERILTYPRSGMAVVSSGGGQTAAMASKSPKHTASAKAQSSGGLSHSAPKPPPVPQQQPPSTGRLRQLVPPSNITEAFARANHSRGIASKLASANKPSYYQQISTAGTLAKNPLYSEIGEHEESIIFSDESHPATSTPANNKPTIGGFALENESRHYAQIQPPMNRQLTYSTFTKPSPPFR